MATTRVVRMISSSVGHNVTTTIVIIVARIQHMLVLLLCWLHDRLLWMHTIHWWLKTWCRVDTLEHILECLYLHEVHPTLLLTRHDEICLRLHYRLLLSRWQRSDLGLLRWHTYLSVLCRWWHEELHRLQSTRRMGWCITYCTCWDQLFFLGLLLLLDKVEWLLHDQITVMLRLSLHSILDSL